MSFTMATRGKNLKPKRNGIRDPADCRGIKSKKIQHDEIASDFVFLSFLPLQPWHGIMHKKNRIMKGGKKPLLLTKKTLVSIFYSRLESL